jgi:nuclear pore complex protein Nup133
VVELTSDLVHSLVDGYVDQQSGYAMIATSSSCKAWNYAKVRSDHTRRAYVDPVLAIETNMQRTNSSPTTYTFPAPQLSRGYGQVIPPVLSAFYSGSSTGEPGLLLISPTGEVHFWETISMALSNVDRYREAEIELGDDDYADKIWRIDVS